MTGSPPPPTRPSRQLLLDEADLRPSPVRTVAAVLGLLLAFGCAAFATWFVAPLAVGAFSPAPRDSAGTRTVVAPTLSAIPPAPAPRTVVRRPPRARVQAPPEPAVLDVNAVPWGIVSLDGRILGDTPILHLEIASGVHRVTVRRDGFEPFVQVIHAGPGERLRLTDITLRRPGG
jgi:PEGA domain-containing protein